MTTENHPLPKEIYDAFDTIDAALFTGCTFMDKKCNDIFREYLNRWERNIPDLPMRIENWAIVIADESRSGYTPPEFQSRRVVGNVYGNPAFEDGTIVTTSRIVEVINPLMVKTKTGSTYILGEPDEKYLAVYPEAASGVKA